jgi:group I intron endonuclease
MGCIYLVTNRINGKKYVGKTKNNFMVRKREHEKNAEKGSRLLFHRALRKYGFGMFSWSVLDHREFMVVEKDKIWMDRWEKHYIKKLNTMVPNGYNLTAGGEGGATFTGKNHTAKTKAKIGASHRGKKLSIEHIAKVIVGIKKARACGLCKGFSGHNHSIESRGKTSRSLRIAYASGKRKPNKLSAESRAKIGNALRGRVGWARGIKKSNEVREKIRIGIRNSARCQKLWGLFV